MPVLPPSIENAIDALSDLPGIGSRSAERLVFSLLRNDSTLDQKIANSIGQLKQSIIECAQCCNYCERLERDSSLCQVCHNAHRNQKIICVVESPVDLVALERTQQFQGLYHVLHGTLSPMNKIGPEHIRIAQLIARTQQNPEITEIILAMSGNVEGDATALYITNKLKPHTQAKITHLSRGIPSGGDLDYLDVGTLSRAIMDRSEY